MELTVRTLTGEHVLADVEPECTPRELAARLHDTAGDAVPPPERQRLFYKQALLPADAALAAAGVVHRDSLVMLDVGKPMRPRKMLTVPAPSAAQIRAAITEEARRRGLEHTLREERPPPAPTARHGMLLPPELLGGADMAESMEQLVGLLEHALGGGGAAVQLQGLMQGLAELSMGGTDQEHDGDDEEESAGDIAVPEPSEERIATLTEMGFSQALARKALLLTRHSVQHALEWILQHGEEPGAEEPPSQEQLRQVWGGGRRPRRRRVAAPPAAAGVAAAAAAATGGAGAAAQVGSTAQSLLTALREIGVDEGEAHHAAQHAVPLDLGALLGQALTAALAPRPAAAARSSHEGANRSGLASSHAVDGGQHGEQQVLSEGAGNREEDGNSDEDDDEYEDYDDEEEEEEEEEDEWTEASSTAMPTQLEQALAGSMGAVQLHSLGSADMEQLLQGQPLHDVLGGQLLASGNSEAQGALLRLMDPGAFQQVVAAAATIATDLGEQQQQQQQDDDEGNQLLAEPGSPGPPALE